MILFILLIDIFIFYFFVSYFKAEYKVKFFYGLFLILNIFIIYYTVIKIGKYKFEWFCVLLCISGIFLIIVGLKNWVIYSKVDKKGEETYGLIISNRQEYSGYDTLFYSKACENFIIKNATFHSTYVSNLSIGDMVKLKYYKKKVNLLKKIKKIEVPFSETERFKAALKDVKENGINDYKNRTEIFNYVETDENTDFINSSNDESDDDPIKFL